MGRAEGTLLIQRRLYFFIAAAALVAFLVMQAEADVITLGLAIEENTRTTAELLKGEAAVSANGVPWDPSA